MNDFVYFGLLSPGKGKGYAFTTYVDRDGITRGHELRKSASGDPIYKRYTFGGSGRRQIRIPRRFTKEIEFLKNHPECKDSLNFRGLAIFKMTDQLEAAQTVVKSKQKRHEVEGKILNLEGESLRNAAIKIANCHDESVMMQQAALLEAAEKDPFFVDDLLSDPSVEAEALLKDALHMGIVTKKGFMYRLGDDYLKGKDSDIIEELTNNTAFRDALKAQVMAKRNIESAEEQVELEEEITDSLPRSNRSKAKK